MRIAVAQLDPTVGDLPGNVDRLLEAYGRAKAAGADLVVAPELAVTGYPPRDLLDMPAFVRDALGALDRLVQEARGPALIVGAVVSHEGDPRAASGSIANGAVLMSDGKVLACHRKILLPTYDVFDEARYFRPGHEATVVQLGAARLGLSVCEDAWNDKGFWERPRYERDPLAEQAAAGATVLINVSASPYHRGKDTERERMLAAAAKRHGLPLIYANQVGGNDSLVFDGRSLALDASGQPIMRGQAFATDLAWVTLEGKALSHGTLAAAPASWEEDVTAALTLGLRDYVHKCGFKDVVLGLSGGIDSALTAALAVRALGKEHVIGIGMPSRFSSGGSVDDARELAQRLGIRFDVLPIEPVFKAYLDTLATPFAGRAADVTEENLQARIRGALLMAYSNKLGALLLTTGNKSEIAVGYCTLYGDMCGGLAVISDVFKTEVYALSRWLNGHVTPPPIPEPSITKPPSAELRDNQTDQDSLPPYDQLDAVLRGYVEELLGAEALIARGTPEALVRRVVRLVDGAEYKRRQMAPGLRVSPKAFGEGRRLPVAQRYRG